MPDYYNVCPYCGANLDPDEKCDCNKKYEMEMKKVEKMLTIPKKRGSQISLRLIDLK